jgi:hypothetical protein
MSHRHGVDTADRLARRRSRLDLLRHRSLAAARPPTTSGPTSITGSAAGPPEPAMKSILPDTPPAITAALAV